jgi:hypothetical protein
LQDCTVIAVVTEYLDVVKYDAGDNDYGLLFAAGSAATAQTINFTAKNDADAIFKGVMMAKEKGFF